jgi:hypothetical protein
VSIILWAVLGTACAFLLGRQSGPGVSVEAAIMMNLAVIGVATGVIQPLLERSYNRILHGWAWWVGAAFVMCFDLMYVWRATSWLVSHN